MDDDSGRAHEIDSLLGQEVVVDVKHAHIYIGTLSRIGADSIVLTDADVHFCGDSLTTVELYLVETKKNGVRPNRKAAYVMRSEVLSISRLDDIIDY